MGAGTSGQHLDTVPFFTLPRPLPAVDHRVAPESYPSSASVKALVLLLLPPSPFLLPPESRQETSLQFATLNFFLAAQPATPGAAAASGPEGRMGRGWDERDPGCRDPGCRVWDARSGMRGLRCGIRGCEDRDARIRDAGCRGRDVGCREQDAG